MFLDHSIPPIRRRRPRSPLLASMILGMWLLLGAGGLAHGASLSASQTAWTVGAGSLTPTPVLGAMGMARNPVLVSDDERAQRRLLLRRLSHIWLATGIGATLASLTVFVLARLSILRDGNPHDDASLRGQPIAIAGLTLMAVFSAATIAALFFIAFQRSENSRREARARAPIAPDLACGCFRF